MIWSKIRDFALGAARSKWVATRLWNWKITSCFAFAKVLKFEAEFVRNLIEIASKCRPNSEFGFPRLFGKTILLMLFWQNEIFGNLTLCVGVGQFEMGCDAAMEWDNYLLIMVLLDLSRKKGCWTLDGEHPEILSRPYAQKQPKNAIVLPSVIKSNTPHV